MRIITIVVILLAEVFYCPQLRAGSWHNSSHEGLVVWLPKKTSPSWRFFEGINHDGPSLWCGEMSTSQFVTNIVVLDGFDVEMCVKSTLGRSVVPLDAPIAIVAGMDSWFGGDVHITADESFLLENLETKGRTSSVTRKNVFYTYRAEPASDEVEEVLWEGVSSSAVVTPEGGSVRNNASAQPVEVSVVCVGDIMLAGNAAPIIEKYGVDYPFDSTREILQKADVAIGNLEMPISVTGESVPDKEYNFLGHPRIVNGLANAGFDVLTLANNHMGDYGDGALLATLDTLAASGIRYCGAGSDLQAARQPAILAVYDKHIAVLAYSNTFPFEYFASQSSPGTARGIAEFFVSDIESAKEWADLVIVSFHWGGELVTEPREYQELFGRKAIEAGANVVFGHHPHVLQGIEIYEGGLIAYSLGNFSFGSYSKNARTSAILRVNFQSGRLKRAEIIPINVANHEVVFQPRLLSGDAAEAVINEIRLLSDKWGTQITTIDGLGVVELQSRNHLGIQME